MELNQIKTKQDIMTIGAAMQSIWFPMFSGEREATAYLTVASVYESALSVDDITTDQLNTVLSAVAGMRSYSAGVFQA